jgi:hypothetical protein
MALSQSRPGKVYFSTAPAVNNLSELATRQPATADAIASFYDRYKIVRGYLYFELTAAITPDPTIHKFFVAGANEITLQPIGSAGTVTVQGSLDGTTFVETGVTAGADGFLRVTAKYSYLTVKTAGSSGTYSIYVQIS